MMMNLTPHAGVWMRRVALTSNGSYDGDQCTLRKGKELVSRENVLIACQMRPVIVGNQAE